MKHILVVFGTRPEGIKMMPVVNALRKQPQIRTTVAVTGQHREMLDQVFSAFGEHPDLDLNLMTRNQTLPELTSNILVRMTSVLEEVKPDVLLVHGDTTTAMAAAMAGFYARIPVGHVEAGLRSFDMSRPWPEEFNRVAIDAVATYLFAPTSAASQNLIASNTRGKILITGNTGIDSLLHFSRLIDEDATIRDTLIEKYRFLDQNRRLIVVTGHRRESFGDGFQRICDGLLNVAQHRDVQLVYPVHLNPHVRTVVLDRLGSQQNIVLCEPIEYLDMVFLMKRSALLITDSGGIQEEGPALGKPVLVLRDVTERPEAVETGVVQLVGTNPVRLQQEVFALLDSAEYYHSRARPVFPYGDGTAALQISQFLQRELVQ